MTDKPKFTLDMYEQMTNRTRTHRAEGPDIEIRVYDDGDVVIAQGEDTVTLGADQAAWLLAELTNALKATP